MFSLTGYIGVQIVLQLVRTGGAFAAVTVTTCRKAVTIIISFLVFQKPFTAQYVYSGMLVVAGIYLNLFSKKNPNFSIMSWVQDLRFKLVKTHQQSYKKFVEEV
jgi:drug/metabolite transporter (DMT)-like permease